MLFIVRLNMADEVGCLTAVFFVVFSIIYKLFYKIITNKTKISQR